jgi:pyridoxal biosynthesis lyase PdxS
VSAAANSADTLAAAPCSLLSHTPPIAACLLLLQVMRGKIRGRVYVNWQELVRDFELICNNAMKYNQKRSRVHKQGLVMLRAGKKLLAEMEAEGRRAMAAMVAAGAAAAAAPASLQMTAADSQALPSSLYRSGEPAALTATVTAAASAAPCFFLL